MKRIRTKSESKDQQIRELKQRLIEAEANLEAIRSGEADAIVVQTDKGISAFTIQGADTAYRIMVETMNEGAITTDPEGVILYVNTRFSQMLNYSPSFLVGKLIQDFIADDQVSAFGAFLKKTIEGESVHQDFKLLKKDGATLPVYFSSAPLEVIGRHDICIVATDLTERYEIQHRLMELNDLLEIKVRERTSELERRKTELEKSQQKLQQLTSSLEEQVVQRTKLVRELAKALSLSELRERQRLSFILHEDLQQKLFSTKTRFDLLKDAIHEGTPEEISEDITVLEALVSNALVTTRRIAIEFNPPVLSSEGLDAALRWIADHIEKQYGLKVDTVFPDSFRVLRNDERVLVVQLVKELLLNIVKHAKTSKATIIATKDQNHIFITVEDKGVGFIPELGKRIAGGLAHMGLFSIEERLRLFGGDLLIESSPGKGTKVTMKIPYDPVKEQLSVE